MKRTMLTGIVLATGIACAREVSLRTPQPMAFADTESAITIPFAGWKDDTVFYRIVVTFESNPTNDLQIALGTDRNTDGDLAPEETDLVCGIDCRIPFVRDERVETSSTAEGESPYVFDLSDRFDRAWNAAKVITRGRGETAAEITARFNNNALRIVLR